MNRPNINVTPLIDVLLVLLISFMVVSPLKPSSFKTRVPGEPRPPETVGSHPDTLAVIISLSGDLQINGEHGLGTIDDPGKAIGRLRAVFAERISNGNISQSLVDDPARPYSDRIERMVFVKAPRVLNYGSVAKIVDAVKVAGAYPISLQVDDLE